MLITLTEDLYKEAIREGERRAAEARRNRRQPRMDVDGDNDRDGMRRQHIDGCIGEYAWTFRMGGRLWGGDGPDPGWDNQGEDGILYQICTRPFSRFVVVDLLVPHNKEVRCDYLALMRIRERPTVECVGLVTEQRWIEEREDHLPYVKPYFFRHRTWYFSAKKLISPQDFIRWKAAS